MKGGRKIWVPATLSAVLSLCILAGCEDSPSDRRDHYFQAEVVPVLEARCGAAMCHGVTPSGLAVGEELSTESFLFLTDEGGKISDWEQARRESLRFVNAVEDPDFSALLRKPLPTVEGGMVHGGRDNFVSLDDPAAQVIRRWIEMEDSGGEDPPSQPTGPGEEFFEERVLPHLVGRNCASAACHGQSSTNGLLLDPGMPDGAGGTRFSRQMVRHNYDASLPFLALDGDPEQSRLLKKSLPLDRGGITHRGGNRTFFTDLDDRASRAIVEWAEIERRLGLGDNTNSDGADSDAPLRGFVYIKGPARRASPFAHRSYQPGSDLYLRKPIEPSQPDRNLTAPFHDGDADIRDPAVSIDGSRVAFAMRRQGDDGHSLFELDLATDELARLTDDGGNDLMPTYGPGETIYFASDRAGRLDERGDPDLAIFRIDGPQNEPQQITFGVGPQLNPRYFDVGDMRGRLVMAHRRTLGEQDETVGFSLPLDFGADYHIYFGVTASEDHLVVFDEMPDGRALTIAADPQNRWEGGKLALVDRNLGPDLKPGQDREDAAVPAFAKTFRSLDDSVRSRGVSYGGVYRDPVALPDGTILVAWAPGPVDLSSADTAPRFRILHLTLREGSTRCTTMDCLPRIDRAREWVRTSEEEMSVHSPRPLVRRHVATAKESALDDQEPTLLTLVDAPVTQGVLENPFASGTKYFRDDVYYLRLLEAAPLTDADDDPRRTLAGHVPTRILAEIELEADRSAYLEIPANRPFRTQLLDERRMAVGLQHNRWIFAWPGQQFPESLERTHYDQACGGCHGAISGAPQDVFGPVDAMSAASATLATFDDRNPRRPRAPTAVADGDSALQITFEDQVGPIVEERCAGCHGQGSDPAGNLVLDPASDGGGWEVYETLVAPGDSGGGHRLVDAANTSARSSRLVEIAAGQPLAAPGPYQQHLDTGVTDEELLTLIRWVETGAAFKGAP